MKRLVVMVFLLLLVGCNETTDITDVDKPTEQESTINSEVQVGSEENVGQEEESVEQEEKSELPVDYDVGPEVSLMIDYMELWESFESQLSFMQIYDGESAYYTEVNKEVQYVKNDPQVYIASHSIAGRNAITEVYATSEKGYISYDLGQWEALENVQEYLQNPLPNKISLLKAMVDFQFEVSWNGNDYIIDFLDEDKQAIYETMLETIFNITRPDGVKVKDASGVITFDPELSAYRLQMTVEHPDYGQGEIVLEETFTNVNGFTEVQVPDGI